MTHLRCSRCKRYKSPESFAWRRKGLGQRDSYCRPCRAAYKQEHYGRNKRRYVDNARLRLREELKARMSYVVEYLERHPCVDCGERDALVLDFDHRGTKRFSIANGIRTRPWEEVLAEIAECDVRCANCHRRRTAEQRGYARLRRAGRPWQLRLF